MSLIPIIIVWSIIGFVMAFCCLVVLGISEHEKTKWFWVRLALIFIMCGPVVWGLCIVIGAVVFVLFIGLMFALWLSGDLKDFWSN